MYTTACVMVDRCMGNVQTVKRLMEVGANINYQNKVHIHVQYGSLTGYYNCMTIAGTKNLLAKVMWEDAIDTN